MIIASLELTITFYATSLKDKRSIVKRILARTKNTFNISAAEVDELDNPGGAVLGFAAVGNDRRYLEGLLQSVERFIDGLELAEVVDGQRDFLYPGDPEHEERSGHDDDEEEEEDAP